jgi:hypothetical protein
MAKSFEQQTTEAGVTAHDALQTSLNTAEYDKILENQKKEAEDRAILEKQKEYNRSPEEKMQEKQRKEQKKRDFTDAHGGRLPYEEAQRLNNELLSAATAYQNYGAQLQEWIVTMAYALEEKYDPAQFLQDTLKSGIKDIWQGGKDLLERNWRDDVAVPGGDNLVSELLDLTLANTGPAGETTTGQISFNKDNLEAKVNELIASGELKQADKENYIKMVQFGAASRLFEAGFMPVPLPEPAQFDAATFNPANFDNWWKPDNSGPELPPIPIDQPDIDSIFQDVTVNQLFDRYQPSNTQAPTANPGDNDNASLRSSNDGLDDDGDDNTLNGSFHSPPGSRR